HGSRWSAPPDERPVALGLLGLSWTDGYNFRLAGVARAKEGRKGACNCGDHEDRPCFQRDIDDLPRGGHGVRDRRRHGEQLNGGEEDCITKTVNFPALFSALEYPYQHGTNGKNK